MGRPDDQFPVRLKAARKQAGLSQAALAKRIGVTHVAVSGWERGVNMPDPPKWKLLADALNAKVGHLLYGTEETVGSPAGVGGTMDNAQLLRLLSDLKADLLVEIRDLRRRVEQVEQGRPAHPRKAERR